MLIDAHCHLDFPQFDEDRDEVIGRALDAGMLIINSGVGPESIRDTLKLAQRYEGLFAACGISPTELDGDLVEETIRLIRENRGSIVAVGEVGLDYYWVKEEGLRRRERRYFSGFIELAGELNLPLVIHSRDAVGDVIDMLEAGDRPVMMHCFGGSLKEAERAVSLGYLISIPASIMYSRPKQRLAGELPLESIVLETDAPYQSPEPGTRNEPLNIRKSAEKIAEVKALDVETVERVTAENTRDFFNIEI